MNGYQRRLFVLLCLAALCSGYAGLSLSQTLPALRREFQLGPEQAGRFIAFINLGQVLSYVLVRAADRFGRRPMFLISLGGYGLLTAATGLTSNAYAFGSVLLIARIFLLALAPLAALFVAEEFPAQKRGTLMGAVFVSIGIGGVLCAALVPLLLRTPWGWRSVYFLSALSLLALGPGLFWLKESSPFLTARAAAPLTSDLWSIWRSQYRGRVLTLCSVFFLTNLCASSVILFWKEFALAERGLSELRIGGIIATASLLAIPLAFLLGQLSDRLGRRRAAVLIYAVSLLGVVGAFTLWSPVLLAGSLLCAIGGSWAVPGLLSTITAESFPTTLRAAAFGWASSLIGRSAFVVAPLCIGGLAARIGWGPAILLTIAAPLLALLILLRMRETAGSSLSQIEA